MNLNLTKESLDPPHLIFLDRMLFTNTVNEHKISQFYIVRFFLELENCDDFAFHYLHIFLRSSTIIRMRRKN